MNAPEPTPATTTAAGRCPVRHDFDPFGPAFQADPGGSMRELREETPIFFSPELDYFVVTRYEDVREIVKDSDNFSPSIGTETLTPLCPAATAKLQEHGFVPVPTLGVMDEPLHGVRRKKMAELFKNENVLKWEPRFREVISAYIDRFVKRGQADLVQDLTWEAPAVIALEFMGVPDEEVEGAIRSAEGLVQFLFGKPSEAEQVAIADLMGRTQKDARRWIEKLAAEPDRPGIIPHAIREHRADPELFPEEAVVAIATTSLAAAHETTSNAAANTLLRFLGPHETWEALCADPSLMETAVEEGLRIAPSSATWRRRCRNATVIGGVTIPAGAKVMVALGAANRDPEVFPDPDRVDLARPNARRHLTFSFGNHLCLGSWLARLEVRVMLEELTRRLPHLRLVEGQSFERDASALGGRLLSLKVEWDPAANPVESDRP